MKQPKVLRIKLKTGELFIRKDVEEFLIGVYNFVVVNKSGLTETYGTDNILSVEMLTNGEYIKIKHKKGGK